MSQVEARFGEVSAHPATRSVPLAHLSVELGHLYAEDYESDPEFLRRHFRQVRPWAEAARLAWADSLPPGRAPRISTCFLVDDYFTPFGTPDEVVPRLVEAAGECGLTIDYLARESGCAESDGVGLARLVSERLVEDPPQGANGSRPPVTQTGWLCNGQRSPVGTAAAMQSAQDWRPPTQNGATRHAIFSDVQLWDGDGPARIWSCPFLASVWQLQRLGLLRHRGQPTALPAAAPGRLPNRWADLPPVVRLNPDAEAFSAYRTLSVLATRFLPVEQGVRTVLSQVAVDAQADAQAVRRSRAEGVEVPAELVDRVGYVFSGATAALR